MNNKILDAIQLYLIGDIDIDSLEYRAITLAWDDELEDQDLVDQVTIELVYIKRRRV